MATAANRASTRYCSVFSPWSSQQVGRDRHPRAIQTSALNSARRNPAGRIGFYRYVLVMVDAHSSSAGGWSIGELRHGRHRACSISYSYTELRIKLMYSSYSSYPATAVRWGFHTQCAGLPVYQCGLGLVSVGPLSTVASRGTFDEDSVVPSTDVRRTGPHSIGYSAVCSVI